MYDRLRNEAFAWGVHHSNKESFMKKFHYHPILLAAILVGFIASLLIGMERHAVEEDSRTVELAIDYEGLLELAAREGLPAEEVLAEAKAAGITSLAVYETTFKKFNENGKANAVKGADILAAYHTGTLTDPRWRTLVEDGKIVGTEIYVVSHDPVTYAELKEDLLRRFGAARITVLTVGTDEVIAVKDLYEVFLKRNIGLPSDEMRAVNAAGFDVIARPSNYYDCTPDDVHAVFARMDGIAVSAIVFSGPVTLGVPKALQTTIDEMRARRLSLGLIEGVTQLQFYKQQGMDEIAKGVGYDHVARLYSIPLDELKKLKIDAAVERWETTDEERNIRINLLRIYEEPAPSMTLLETNMKYFADTRAALEAKGFKIGRAGMFASYEPSRVLRALVIMGVAAAGVLYLSLVIPALNRRRKTVLLCFAVAALISMMPILIGAGSKVRLVAALASANLFPALAIVALLDLLRTRRFPKDTPLWRILVAGLVLLGITSALSMIGASYLSGALADTRYLLEFDIFRGIKLTFVLPMILVAAAFLQRFDIFDGQFDASAGVFGQLREIMGTPVRVGSLLGGLVLLGALVVLVLRSGHTSGMPVPGIELKMRAALEQIFYARPRTKEFLIGHPAFLLALYGAARQWKTWIIFGLVLAATIGQGSMVETFAHMRTPVEMSLVRGIGGVFLGGAIGAVLVALVAAWNHLLERVRRAV
ncbi:brp/Blh family beta-carotene 15,15'-monooxygenase [Centipeda periodontii DSM 2778]|uniref:Brp/Blh family beta-carotene 15,15'-monooxygenase n=2 Tax=Centipeda TaxID=82202 RepID=F5RK27_9FIRM|nr:brp/Blh family beta-carotene 15,15'-monooxygenase [Centipeda periodontii DSM 2778]